VRWDKETKVALVQVRNLIERLRAAAGRPPKAESSARGGLFFLYRNLGGIRLTGAEAEHYGRCLDTLIGLQGTNPNLRVTSDAAVEELLRKTILRSLRLRRPTEPRERFVRRVNREVRSLGRALVAAPEEWELCVPIHGLAPAMLPLRFGGVEFVAGSQAAAESATRPIVEVRSESKRVTTKRQVEEGLLPRERQEKINLLKVGPLATVSVLATDHNAAVQRGLEHVRRTLGILTFFAGFFDPMRHRYRAFVAPEGQRQKLHWVVRSVSSGRANAGWANPKVMPVARIDIGTDRAREIGLPRADQMLANRQPTDLEMRILTSLAWAGRAHAEYRREQSFMLLAIALESLLTKATARSGVTERLCRRVAHILGTSPKVRRDIFQDVEKLYKVRSILVHTGDSTELTDEDLGTLESLVDGVLARVLADEPFASMKTAREFDEWLDDQLLK
jgi:hypothetical protein